MARQMPEGRRFPPGQSGNPGGRPKVVREVVDLARSHTAEAIGRLCEWMRSDNAAASVRACEALLERGWGRAPTSEDFDLAAKLDELERLVAARNGNGAGGHYGQG